MTASDSVTNTGVNSGNVPQYRQVISPSYQQGSFTADDTDNHDFRFDARGKGRATVQAHNNGDQTLTVSVYGAPDSTAEIGDEDVEQIGGSFTASANDGEYETVNDPFPFYLVRATYGSTPSGSNTTTIYMHFHSA